MRVRLVLSGIEEQRGEYAVAIFQDLIQRKTKQIMRSRLRVYIGLANETK